MQITFRGSAFAALFAIAASGLFGQTMPQNFVSVTPCRIADTRTSSGGAGPITGGTYRNFTIAGVCGIPSTAAAFSLNVTAVPNPSGSSLLFLSVLPAPASTPTSAPSSSTLNDPLGTIVANAALVPSGDNGAVTVYVSNKSDVILDTNGYFVDQTNAESQNTALGTGTLTGGTGNGNTAVGYFSLISSSGSFNTSLGDYALSSDSSGNNNTALGASALANATTGSNNTGIGSSALTGLSSGGNNTAVGDNALVFIQEGVDNTAVGYGATSGSETSYTTAVGYNALSISSGHYGTAVGYEALQNTTTGTTNLALGAYAGLNITSGSNNIDISNGGDSGDSGVIRIGTSGDQSATYIAGIAGKTVSGAAVLVSSSGQLGVQSSSIRFKEDVHEMGDATDRLMQLRPVEFRYKQAAEDGSKPLQFGLIAEEVAKVYPELVVRGTDGQIDSVKYHELPAMLLNEIQKQHRTIEELEADKADQQGQLKSLQNANTRLEAEMEKLRALITEK